LGYLLSHFSPVTDSETDESSSSMHVLLTLLGQYGVKLDSLISGVGEEPLRSEVATLTARAKSFIQSQANITSLQHSSSAT
jgi:hypothetical protein